MCVRSLSKKARMKDLNVPDFDIVTYTIAMPTFMVGSIRRRLEQSLWSSTSSSGCSPCMDLKEIYRQRSLDSDYMWHHSSCSESDDAEDTYRENELQSPASITSYDDADISSFIGDDLAGSGSVAEEYIYPSQNFLALTWEQDEDVLEGAQSVETYLDASMHFPHSNSTSNGNLQVTTLCCNKSPFRVCEAHLDARTSSPFMEDINWLQTKSVSNAEIHKFDFGLSSVNTPPSGKLASESNSYITVNAKEKYETSSSCVSQNDSIAKLLPGSCPNLDSAKEESTEATAVPLTSKQLLTCITEDCDTIESTCMLLDKVNEETNRHVLVCGNGLSECIPAGLIDSLSENRQQEVLLMDTERKVMWHNPNILGLNAGSYVKTNLIIESPELLSVNMDSILKNGCSVSDETAAHDQSCLHFEALNVNLKQLENKTTCEVGDAKVSLMGRHDSGKTVTAVCQDLSDTGGSLRFPDVRSPEMNSQIDLASEVPMEELPCSVDDEDASVSMLNELSLDGNAVDCISDGLLKLSIGTTDLDRDTAVCYESQAATTDNDPCTSEILNKDLIDDIFPGMAHVDSVSEEHGPTWVSIVCTESNNDYSPRNRHCSHFIDVIEDVSHSSLLSGKQFNDCLSHNADAFSAEKEQVLDFFPQLHYFSLSSDSFGRVYGSLVAEDVILEKLVVEDGISCSSAFEEMKQIPLNAFGMNEIESQAKANCLCKACAFEENRRGHQIAGVDGKSCSQSMENPVVNNLQMEGFGKQTAGIQHTIIEREEKSLLIELGKISCPCRRKSDQPVEINQDSFVEPCTGNSITCCIKDKVQQSIDCTHISQVPEEKCLTHKETVPGSLCAEESSISILHLLDVNPRENKVSEELCQKKVQKMDSNVSASASLPVVDISEGQASLGTRHGHLDQAEACTLKIGGLELALASSEDCLQTSYLDSNNGSINLEAHTNLCTYDLDTTAHCDSVSSTGYLEFSSHLQREGGPCSTTCVLDMKSSADQGTEVNNHHQPLMDEGEDRVCHNDHAHVETLNKDVEDGDMRVRTSVRPDEKNSEEAAGLESKPAKKILLKSFAGGMTFLGALFLFLHIRRRKERGSTVTNVMKSQAEKENHERRPDKDKHGRLYPAEKFKF